MRKGWGKKMSSVEKQEINIDIEWKFLMLEARNIGLTVEEVRDFIQGEAKSKSLTT